MKFYFIELKHKASSKILYKFGITTKEDVLERFNPKYDKRYKEFVFRVLVSIRTEDKKVKELENKLLHKYPKNFILEEFLNVPFRYFDNLGGITELRILSKEQKNSLLNKLYKIKQKIEI